MAMPEWVKKELRSNLARASRAGRLAAKTEPRAARATYRARDDALRIELTNGAVITLPLKLIPGLAGPEWMAELGRVGGRRSSTVNAAAARRNGRKGGRPRNRAIADMHLD